MQYTYLFKRIFANTPEEFMECVCEVEHQTVTYIDGNWDINEETGLCVIGTIFNKDISIAMVTYVDDQLAKITYSLVIYIPYTKWEQVSGKIDLSTVSCDEKFDIMVKQLTIGGIPIRDLIGSNGEIYRKC